MKRYRALLLTFLVAITSVSFSYARKLPKEPPVEIKPVNKSYEMLNAIRNGAVGGFLAALSIRCFMVSLKAFGQEEERKSLPLLDSSGAKAILASVLMDVAITKLHTAYDCFKKAFNANNHN